METFPVLQEMPNPLKTQFVGLGIGARVFDNGRRRKGMCTSRVRAVLWSRFQFGVLLRAGPDTSNSWLAR